MIYIKFPHPISKEPEKKERLIKKGLKNRIIKILEAIIPKANPDFDGKIQAVDYWYLEIDNETGVPEREIGFDDTGKAIMIMPWNNNYGFWTDSNLKITDFDSFGSDAITAKEFERAWSDFENGTTANN